MGNKQIDLNDITDDEDPRIAEAADEVLEGFRRIIDEIGPDVALALVDAVGERLDNLGEELNEEIEEDGDEDDDADAALLTDGEDV